jgi:hypothetical protein
MFFKSCLYVFMCNIQLISQSVQLCTVTFSNYCKLDCAAVHCNIQLLSQTVQLCTVTFSY